MKNARMTGSIIILLFSFLLLLPSIAEASCDEYERDFVLQKLLLIQIRGNAMDRGFIHLARGCGFDVGARRTRRGATTYYRHHVALHAPRNLDSLINRTANRYGVDPALVKALIHAESSFARTAVSPKGARGLTQVMPATARELGVSPNELWNSSINIDTGVRYLAINIQRFGSVKKALIAYNAGPDRAARVHRPGDLRRIPKETREYLKRVLSLYRRYRGEGVIYAKR